MPTRSPRRWRRNRQAGSTNSGPCTTCSSRTRRVSRARSCAATPRSSSSTCRSSTSRWLTRCGCSACGSTWRALVAAACEQRPRSSLTPCCRTSPSGSVRWKSASDRRCRLASAFHDAIFPKETSMLVEETRQRRAAALKTPSDLGQDATRDLAGGLNVLLADLFALYVKTKNFHWHVSGPHFRDYHLMLDEQADQVFA